MRIPLSREIKHFFTLYYEATHSRQSWQLTQAPGEFSDSLDTIPTKDFTELHTESTSQQYAKLQSKDSRKSHRDEPKFSCVPKTPVVQNYLTMT